MSLTLNIATRGRPDHLRDTVIRTLANVQHPDTFILLSVDADDAPTIESLDRIPKDGRLLTSIEPREDTRWLKYDRALRLAPADVYLCGVDYAPILTPGFDWDIINAAAAFPDGIGCVCTPLANASFPGLQAPTAGLVKHLGYIYPPQFPFWFGDHWIDDISRMIDRYHMVNVVVEHSRTRPGKTIGLRDVGFWATYFDAHQLTRRKQALAIIKALDEPEWRKDMLRANFPLIEYRSQWVNDIVRAQAAEIERDRGDDGEPSEAYRRVFVAAMAEMPTLVREWEALAA
jgi:hypothetical protein